MCVCVSVCLCRPVSDSDEWGYYSGAVVSAISDPVTITPTLLGCCSFWFETKKELTKVTFNAQTTCECEWQVCGSTDKDSDGGNKKRGQLVVKCIGFFSAHYWSAGILWCTNAEIECSFVLSLPLSCSANEQWSVCHCGSGRHELKCTASILSAVAPVSLTHRANYCHWAVLYCFSVLVVVVVVVVLLSAVA